MAEPPATPPRRLLWAVTLPALFVPGVAALLYFVVLAGSPVAPPAYGAAKLFILAWPLAATVLLLQRRVRPRLRPVARHLRALPLGAATGLAVAGIMAAWMAVPGLAGIVEAGAPGVRRKVEDLGILGHYAAFAVWVSVLHSALEEYYWRWFVFGNLRQLLPLPAAHLVAGGAFTLHHIVVTAQFFPLPWALFFSACVGVGGVIWSVLYQRQGTIAGAWLSHAIIDAALMILGWHLLQL